MLARIYFIAGTLLLVGYGVTSWEGWEYSNPMRLVSAPAIGVSLRSSDGGTNSSHSSGSRSGWVIFGGK